MAVNYDDEYDPERPNQDNEEEQGFDPNQASPNTGVTGTGSGGGANNPAPAPQFNREQFRDAWMSSGTRNMAGLRSFISSNPAYSGVQVLSDNGIVRLPTGEELDLGISFRTGNGQPGWTGVGPTAGPGVSVGNPGSGGGGWGNGGGMGMPDDEIHRMLMEELRGLRGPIDPNDPRLKDQVDAFRNEQNRSRDRGQEAMAERGAYSGIASGAQDSLVQGSYDKVGQQTGAFSAATVGKEYENRRNELDRLMALAIQTGDNASARELQMAIANMDSQYRYAALGQNNQQFYDDLDWRRFFGTEQLNRGIEESL